jgi:predicted Zn-dependent protease
LITHGEKLIKHLPNQGIKFQFFIIDIPEANAFNIPGGYVFISRKLIGFAANEDEVAGVIAHELGHAVVSTLMILRAPSTTKLPEFLH